MKRLQFSGDVSVRPLYKLGLTVALIGQLLAFTARADIIIDDFDDAAQTVSPAMDKVFVPTEHVGPLDAFRQIRLASFAANPDATMGIGDSLLRVEVGDLHATGLGFRSRFAAQLYYEFEPTDFSSGNAFLVDFNSVQGSELPEMIRFLIFDDSSFSFYDEFRPVPAGRYTAVLPFADFIRRDGVRQDINFTKIWRVWPEFYAQRLDDYTNHDWTIEVERIRVGTVPEPRGLGLFLLTLLWRRRRCERLSWSWYYRRSVGGKTPIA